MGIPIDASGQLIPLAPSGTALATTYDTTISSATSVALNAATRFVRISAINQGVFLRWNGTAAATSGSFDDYIDAGQTIDFQLEPSQSGTTISVIGADSTAAVVIVEK